MQEEEEGQKKDRSMEIRWCGAIPDSIRDVEVTTHIYQRDLLTIMRSLKQRGNKRLYDQLNRFILKIDEESHEDTDFNQKISKKMLDRKGVKKGFSDVRS